MVTLFLRLHDYGVFANEIFRGLWLLPFGLHVYCSGFVPRILGIWLGVGHQKSMRPKDQQLGAGRVCFIEYDEKMIALVLAVFTYCRFSSAATASGWRLPRYASNWWCSSVNSHALVCAALTERSGWASASCGRAG